MKSPFDPLGSPGGVCCLVSLGEEKLEALEPGAWRNGVPLVLG